MTVTLTTIYGQFQKIDHMTVNQKNVTVTLRKINHMTVTLISVYYIAKNLHLWFSMTRSDLSLKHLRSLLQAFDHAEFLRAGCLALSAFDAV